MPEASPEGESKSTDLREPSKTSFLGATIWNYQSRSPLLAWLVEYCSNLLLPFHKGGPHDGHTAYMRLKGKSWRVGKPPRVEMPSFDECVAYRKCTRWIFLQKPARTRAKLDVCSGACVVVETLE